MNPELPLTRATAATLGALLGMTSGLACWLVLFHLDRGPVSLYLPGAILGAFLCIEAHLMLGQPRPPLLCLGAAVLAVIVSWRLAQLALGLGGPLQWFMASLLGTLGAVAALWLAWPRQVAVHRLLLVMTAVGIGGGGLFWLANTLRLYDARHLWPLVLLCTWQGALLTAAATCLHGARRS